MVDHWEPYYDGEYGEWYDIPIYDYTQAKFTATAFLPSSLAAHDATLTVTEQTSGQTSIYTWTFPAENCKSCHDGYPTSHEPGLLSNCASCHTTSGPVYVHNSGFGGCDNCHGRPARHRPTAGAYLLRPG